MLFRLRDIDRHPVCCPVHFPSASVAGTAGGAQLDRRTPRTHMGGPAPLRQRAGGISEFLKANPPNGAIGTTPPQAPNIGAAQSQETKPK